MSHTSHTHLTPTHVTHLTHTPHPHTCHTPHTILTPTHVTHLTQHSPPCTHPTQSFLLWCRTLQCVEPLLCAALSSYRVFTLWVHTVHTLNPEPWTLAVVVVKRACIQVVLMCDIQYSQIMLELGFSHRAALLAGFFTIFGKSTHFPHALTPIPPPHTPQKTRWCFRAVSSCLTRSSFSSLTSHFSASSSSTIRDTRKPHTV